MELAGQIRRRRKELGLSQEELAERIYVSRQTVSNWETGRTYPDIESLLLMSSLFNATVDELIKGDVETMKEDMNQDARRMSRLSWAMTLCTLGAVVILLCGFTVWDWGLAPTLVSGILMVVLAMVPAFEVERLKKKHDILTYAELSAFEKGEEVNRDTPAGIRARRHPLRSYALKVLAGAVFGMIVGFAGMYLIISVFGWQP